MSNGNNNRKRVVPEEAKIPPPASPKVEAITEASLKIWFKHNPNSVLFLAAGILLISGIAFGKDNLQAVYQDTQDFYVQQVSPLQQELTKELDRGLAQITRTTQNTLNYTKDTFQDLSL